MAMLNKEDMMEYYRDKWYFHIGEKEFVDFDIIDAIKSDIVSFKNDPTIYWINELICTMDLENLLEMRENGFLKKVFV